VGEFQGGCQSWGERDQYLSCKNMEAGTYIVMAEVLYLKE
jgi:hypothetical protein